MALVSNLGQLQSRIARRLGVEGQGLEIREELEGAIESYSGEPFWWLQGVTTGLELTAQQANYNLPTDFLDLHTVTVNSTGEDLPLDPVDWERYRWLNTNEVQFQSQPSKYSLYNGQIWFYPTPAQAYPYTLYYRKRFAELSTPTATNDWITYGWRLLFNHVCGELAADSGAVLRFQAAAARELNELRSKSEARATVGQWRARDF